MEEKILAKLEQLDAKMDNMKEEFRQENDKIRQEFKQDNDKLREELHEEMNDFRKEMLDKMFLFEQDYGAKIDAIFDVAIMQKDIIQTVYKNQEELKIRVDNLDIKLLALDQRVFKLEHPKNLK